MEDRMCVHLNADHFLKDRCVRHLVKWRLGLLMYLRIGCSFILVCSLSGCQRYQARPLHPIELVNEVDAARQAPDEAVKSSSNENSIQTRHQFTFDRAVAIMEQRSPALRQVRAEYQTALALAKVKTPFPNPSIEIGPHYGFGADVASTHRLQPFGSLGFAIPTAGRLKRQDELNELQAAFAFVEAAAKQRELYLEMRKQYARLVFSQAKISSRKLSTKSAEKSAALVMRSVEGGQATTLDQTLIELDLARAKAEVLSAESEIVGIQGELSEIIGVSAEQLGELPVQPLPVLPETARSLQDLRQILIHNHPALARIRARYEVAERELHLEIAKQYPDFRIGPSFERDVGEQKNSLGLTLGIELPVFDRNQQAIATAMNRRDEIRVKYEAAANTALAALERARRLHALVTEKLHLQKSVILPKSTESLNLARKALENGTSDLLHVLETERTHRSIEVDTIETELAVFQSWNELEHAVGCPLVRFPSETVDLMPLTTDDELPRSSKTNNSAKAERRPNND